jgi:N-acetylneuraminic acid mutarotase
VQEIYPPLHRGAIWIAGGFSTQSGGATERVIMLDLARQTWSEGPALPTPSHHVQLASAGGELYAIGGFIGGPTRNSWICTTRVLKLAGDGWIEAVSLPKPIGEAVPIVHLNRIHLIGGRSPRGAANAGWGDHVDVADHFVFAPGASEWTSAAPLPTARNSSAGVSNGDRLHVISGRSVTGGETPAYDIYDPRTGRWDSGPAYPEPHGGIAGAYWRDRIVAGGGEVFGPGTASNALYALENGAWARLETMPTPRHGHGLVAANSALYAIGGARFPATRETLSSVDVLS